MSLFEQDPALALAKTEDKIGSIESNIEALRAKRAEKLLEVEDPGEIIRLDKSIEAEQANLIILGDRVRVLNEEIRRHAFEVERTGVGRQSRNYRRPSASVKPSLPSWEAAITEVGELYSQLTAPDYAVDVWPFSSPGHAFADFDRAPVDKEIGWALHSLVQGHGLPMPNSIGLGVFNERPAGIAETVRSQVAGIVARAESAPIHDDLLSEAV
jgi:hypothetical protein